MNPLHYHDIEIEQELTTIASITLLIPLPVLHLKIKYNGVLTSFLP